eukprot:TRINITY_DN4673_c0_g1_i7.p1 TRINITY_DN4673_c0_g1~~TRINITY_DN4673_c0_g1_i7.p1  ORF type:complete len:280 (+),score=45.78 TRINITY_DN4673_c0_g1_i7:70-909(+)
MLPPWMSSGVLLSLLFHASYAFRFEVDDNEAEVLNASEQADTDNADSDKLDPFKLADPAIRLLNGRTSKPISYEDVLIPRAKEMEEYWALMKKRECDENYETGLAEVDIPIRFCALAYQRNSGETSQWTIFAGSPGKSPSLDELTEDEAQADGHTLIEANKDQAGDAESSTEVEQDGEDADPDDVKHKIKVLPPLNPEIIEVQFHGTGNLKEGAHAIVYLYKGPRGGVGVVITYKGSTMSLKDWGHNVRAWPEDLLKTKYKRTATGPEADATLVCLVTF